MIAHVNVDTFRNQTVSEFLAVIINKCTKEYLNDKEGLSNEMSAFGFVLLQSIHTRNIMDYHCYETCVNAFHPL